MKVLILAAAAGFLTGLVVSVHTSAPNCITAIEDAASAVWQGTAPMPIAMQHAGLWCGLSDPGWAVQPDRLSGYANK